MTVNDSRLCLHNTGHFTLLTDDDINCDNITVELATNHNRIITAIKRAFHDQITENIG